MDAVKGEFKKLKDSTAGRKAGLSEPMSSGIAFQKNQSHNKNVKDD
ncbi:hypothetical protein SAMN04488511_1139 [Pedobacter suwonensis]|uniref:Uncharacterized protein n=1 Tax=Pedobacter suwonensis TaxID=332999 RepID=A0A1I0TQT8_9SPHI|nr:hypothetical protein [Pedobacter suwonensis]SFA54082.1 hypothetical protein SAMN04488511_1139 [Pedobacter suwonensis]